MKKEIIIPITTTIVSATIATLVYHSIIPLGKIINIFIQCEQIPTNSFPCYGVYDIIAVLILMSITLGSLIFTIIKLKQPNDE